MKIEPGHMLSHYRLVEKIGEGGMGVVWKALDTTLEREVAIKILPDVFSQDAERLARFEREAKLLASLNHPNIATVHGLHRAEDVRFLAMELVGGEDLAKLLERGALPVQDALNVAGQVAEALEAAHETGVIHRDLKPANIQLTPGGQVKVLDFGLAKAFEPDGASGSATMSPTVTSAGTFAGMILGTAAYMSPEQAKGKAVDRRADIWAFGVVLVEMITGKAVFEGETISETLAQVMMSGPDLAALPDETPAGLRRLLSRCLEKEPLQRLRDIGEARIAIQGILSGHAEPDVPSVTAPVEQTRSARWPIAIGALILGAAAAGLAAWNVKPTPELPLRKLDLTVKDLGSLGGVIRGMAISPDGERVAYVGQDGFYIRDLDRIEPRAVRTAGGTRLVFWSPDSAWIGYAADGKLWKVPTAGGEGIAITELEGNLAGGSGASWGTDGVIVFSRGNTGLLQVSSRGGDVRPLLEVDVETDDDYHEPYHLPGNRGLLFVNHRKSGDPDTIELYADGKRKVLLQIEGQQIWNPVYAPSGHVLYRRQPNNAGIWALPFSLEKLEASGEPFLVAAEADDATVSSNGTMVYIRGASVQATQLVWVDRTGQVQGTIGQPQENILFPELSPDGNRVAVSAEENENRDIWIHDAVRGTKTRLSFDPMSEWVADWSPNGTQIAFSGGFGTQGQTWVKAADGTGEPSPLVDGLMPAFSPDGQYLTFNADGGENSGDVAYLRLEGEAQVASLIQTPASEGEGQVSPDGRYLAYVSDESGSDQILLTRFPSGEGKWQVSANGGRWPRWSGRGDELFYIESGKVMVVQVDTRTTPELGTPEELFSGITGRLRIGGPRLYDVSADGQRFVMVQMVGDEDEDSGVTVVQNWLAEFRDQP